MKKKQLKRIATMLSLSMVLGIVAPTTSLQVQAATERWNDASTDSVAWENWKTNWDAYSSNYENVSLTPGVNETELNFAWYSKTGETPAVKIATNVDMTGAVEYKGKQETAVIIDETQYYSNKVTIKDLKENTQYYYQVYKNGGWTEAEEYSTKSFSSFSFLYVGDPQIGASKGKTNEEGDSMNSASDAVTSTAEANLAARNDAYNWNKILNKAVAEHSDVSFMVSAGDQVNYASNEREYAGYLGAEALKSLPVATTIGNHDSGSNQYTLHYNNPNAFTADDAEYTNGKTAAGTDYYYTYGDVLFIVLDTNNYNCATHENVIKKAISENQDTKWRVVMFHQDIYGSGKDHSASDGIVLRTQLTSIFDENDIDVVLQGHDHTYSRTYQLTGDGEEHTSYNNSNYRNDADFLTQNNCYIIKSNTQSGTVVNPEGTVYLEANSSTGSKFYELIATQQDYIAERSQTWTPSYSVINVDEDSFSITTYDGSTGQELNGSSTYTIVKDDRAQQEITGADSYEKKVGDAAFVLDAKAEGKLSYESDNEEVAEVTKSGKVYINGEGTATITVTATATDTKAETIKEIIITVSKADEVKDDRTAQVIAGTDSYEKKVGDAAFALDAKAEGKLSYESDNEEVAVVTTSGKIHIIGEGNATITVKAAATDTKKEATKAIKVTVAKADEVIDVKTQSITCSDSYVKAYGDKKFELKATTDGNGTLSYVSSDTNVVDVDNAGKVSIKGIGTATIVVNAAATDSYKEASAIVKITVNPKKVTISKVISSKKAQATVKWKKDSKVTGYQVVYASNKSFTKNVTTINVKKKSKTSYVIKKLTSKKKIYVKIRAYKTVNGEKLYGKYSTVKSVKVK